MGKGDGKGEASGEGKGELVYLDPFGIGRQICGCLCCLLCTGPFLILIGIIVLFSAADDTRGEKEANYNKAVNSWTNTGRDEFEGAMGFSVFQNDGSLYPFIVDTTGDDLDDTADTLQSYKALKYVASNAVLFSTNYTNNGNTISKDINFLVMNGNTTFINSLNGFTVKSLSPSQLSEQTPCRTNTYNSNSNDPTCASVCVNLGGVYDNARDSCAVKSIMTKACIKLIVNNNRWIPDQDFGGYGCYPGNDLSWAPEEYRTSNVQNGDSINIGATAIVLRSSSDPFVIAGDMTDGTYNFGLTTGQKLATGLILIIIGGVFMAPAILITVLVVFYCRRRGRGRD